MIHAGLFDLVLGILCFSVVVVGYRFVLCVAFWCVWID